MALTAQALFDFCTRRQCHDEQDVQPMADRIEVAGTVKRAALSYDHTPLILLDADAMGTCYVECRCLSDEVLLRAKVGSRVTLAGFCRGLEDSVTAVMDRCELLGVNGRKTHDGAGLKTSKTRLPDPGSPRCSFCGRPRTEVHRLLTIGEKSICDRCVGEYSLRLREEGCARAPLGSGASVVEFKADRRGDGSHRARRILRWLRRRWLSASPPAA